MIFLIFTLGLWTLLAFLYWVFLFKPDTPLPIWVGLNFALAIFTIIALLRTDAGVPLYLILPVFATWPAYLPFIVLNALPSLPIAALVLSPIIIGGAAWLASTRPPGIGLLTLAVGAVVAFEAAAYSLG